MCDMWGKLPGLVCHTLAVNGSPIIGLFTASLVMSKASLVLQSPSQFYLQPMTPGCILRAHSCIELSKTGRCLQT